MRQRVLAVTAIIGMAAAQLMTGSAYAQSSDSGPGNPTLLNGIQNLQTSLSAGNAALLQAIQNLNNSGSAGITAVLQAIQSIQTSVANLQSSVVNLQSSINTINAPGQSKQRFSPPVFAFANDFVVCFVTNVSDETRTVDTDMRDQFGTTVEHLAGLSVKPGATENPVVHQSVGVGSFYHCKFTVTNGSRTDIRASINVNNETPATVQRDLAAE